MIPIGLLTITMRPVAKQSSFTEAYPSTVSYAARPLSISVDINLFVASCVVFIVKSRFESNAKIFSKRLTVYVAVVRCVFTFVAPDRHVLFARTEICGGCPPE